MTTNVQLLDGQTEAIQQQPKVISETEEAYPTVMRFLEIIRPKFAQSCQRLTGKACALTSTAQSVPFDPTSVAEILASEIPSQLAQMLSRTMVLELNVARLRGELQGETAAARFDDFIEKLHEPEYSRAILQEYPVLERQVEISLELWVESSLEFLKHLTTDWHDICSAFFAGVDPGRLNRVEEAGDKHRGGRGVLLLGFEKGQQIVYKPKPLSIDLHFQRILEWTNERGFQPALRPLQILEQGDHGWVEFISAEACATRDQVDRFYERLGGQLALLYLLEGTDLHSENLLAAGEHPVLVDLETLFHTIVPHAAPCSTEAVGEAFLDRSVLRTGLLPERIFTGSVTLDGTEGPGIDISGLGAEDEQRTPFGVPRWEGLGTDAMKTVFKQVTIPGAANRPRWDGQSVRPADFKEQLIVGFQNMYRLMMRDRAEFLAKEGPLARCAKDTVRRILRPTTTYCVLLRESFHPDLLRDRLVRNCFFDKLRNQIELQPALARVISVECADLWQGDIPIFVSQPDSRDLWSSRNKRIADYYSTTAMELVRDRIENLNEADLERQIWVIRASMRDMEYRGAHQHDQERERAFASFATGAKLRRVSSSTNAGSDLLAAACDVAKRLETLAIKHADGITWMGIHTTDERSSSLKSLGSDLYSGLPGVTLFLAHLGSTTGKSRWTDLAAGALSTMRQQMLCEKTDSIGAFDGWGGTVYVLSKLAELWNDARLKEEACVAAEELARFIDRDFHFDIVSGCAGAIAALLNLYRIAPLKRVRGAAIACGERLLQHAVSMKEGCGWLSPNSPEPLTGFSHGNSGIAWALCDLGKTVGDQRYLDAAEEALAYERSCYCEHHSNWLDLRETESKDRHCVTAWCHGAPGIGLARLRMLQCGGLTNLSKLRSELEVAIQATVEYGVGRNHSLCHGDLGNLELLLEASRFLDTLPCPDHLPNLTGRVLDDIQQHGWKCAQPQRLEIPGLMTGLAGIGYGLLRLAAPERTPSVLTLQ